MRLLLVALFLEVVDAGFQTGPFSGATYAGGMVAHGDKLYVTGASYGGLGSEVPSLESSCFMGIIDDDSLKFLDQDVFGVSSVSEVCTAVTMTEQGTAILVGSSGTGGLLEDINSSMDGSSYDYGVFMHMRVDNNLVGPRLGGQGMPGSPVLYPAAVVSQGTSFYVASQYSSDSSFSEVYEAAAAQGSFPNWITSHKYGTSYDMVIHKYTMEGDDFFVLKWEQFFFNSRAADGTFPTVNIGGMLIKDKVLLVVGSTRGSGEAFGGALGNDEDGFITKIELETGALYTREDDYTVNVGRLGVLEQDDYLTNICDDPNDPDIIYVTGATRGSDNTLTPTLTQVRVTTLSINWKQEFTPFHPADIGIDAAAFAYHCHVIRDGDQVYVAGDIKDGAALFTSPLPSNSAGGDDVWIAQVSATDGTIIWSNQFGSAHQEALGGLAVDASGNAILLGSTTGSLYRAKNAIGDDHADLFTTRVDQNDGSISGALMENPPPGFQNSPIETSDSPFELLGAGQEDGFTPPRFPADLDEGVSGVSEDVLGTFENVTDPFGNPADLHEGFPGVPEDLLDTFENVTDSFGTPDDLDEGFPGVPEDFLDNLENVTDPFGNVTDILDGSGNFSGDLDDILDSLDNRTGLLDGFGNFSGDLDDILDGLDNRTDLLDGFGNFSLDDLEDVLDGLDNMTHLLDGFGNFSLDDLDHILDGLDNVTDTLDRFGNFSGDLDHILDHFNKVTDHLVDIIDVSGNFSGDLDGVLDHLNNVTDHLDDIVEGFGNFSNGDLDDILDPFDHVTDHLDDTVDGFGNFSNGDLGDMPGGFEFPKGDASVFEPVGIQIKGPLYAGGITYNPFTKKVRFTGGSYVSTNISQCFFGTVSLEDQQVTIEPLGEAAHVPEACSSLAIAPEAKHGYLVGETEPGGIFTEFATESNTTVAQFGTVVQIGLYAQFENVITGGYLIQGNAVTYPVAVFADDTNEYIYVASMVSKSAVETSDALQIDKQAFPDLTSGGFRRFGLRYHLQLSKLRILKFRETDVDLDRLTLTSTYSVEYMTDDESSVYTTGITMVGDSLIVVGSTRGTGSLFGSGSGEDLDGFVLALDPNNGLGQSVGVRASTRINSPNSKDDWILNVCSDPNESNAFYILGATMGYNESNATQPAFGSIQPFVVKISSHTLVPMWWTQLKVVAFNSNPTDASAYGCVVNPVDDQVYVAGVVKDGASMQFGDQSSKGKDDIFVAALRADDGSVEWMNQVGTAGNDRLAHGGGIAVDVDGNPIVMAETTGVFYTPTQTSRHLEATDDEHDVVIFSMSKETGTYQEPTVPANNDGKTAMQSGPDVGPTYAGGIAYHSTTNVVYVTGATYGLFGGSLDESSSNRKGSCFLGVLPLSDFEFQEHHIFGTAHNPEACSALDLTSYDGQPVSVLIGSTTEGGLMTNFAENEVTQYGFVFAVDGSDNKLVGGTVMDDRQVQYPVAVETDSVNNHVYVVTMNSNDSLEQNTFDEYANKEYPNLTTGGFTKFGSSFFIVVEQFALKLEGKSDGLRENMELQWSQRLAIEDGNGSDFASGMVMTGVDPTLIVVGSTRESPDNEAMNGFIVKISPADGSFVAADSISFVASADGRDEWLTNVCADPNDKDYFYIVGGTMGTLDDTIERADTDYTVHAFVSKMSVSSMKPLWTKQFSITQASGEDAEIGAALALGCDVISGDGLVYVAGVIENGASIDIDTEQQSSSGSDDIFVAQLNTDNGAVKWLKQVGSNGVDRLARGGGVVADKDGNAVVFGDTTGSLYRSRSSSNSGLSEVFVSVFDKADGAHELPVAKDEEKEDTQDGGESASKKASDEEPDDEKEMFMIWIIIAAAGVAFLWLVAVLVLSLRRRRSQQRQNGQVRQMDEPVVIVDDGPDEVEPHPYKPSSGDDDISVGSVASSATSLSQGV